MLGILLLYWIGKYFYKLAEEHNKSKWGFAILGIITYYVGTFLFGIILGIVIEQFSPGFVESIDEMLLGIILLPFGILSCYIFYKLLENSWKEDLKGPNTTDFIQRN
ncbi:hypothetical protein GCM10011344_05310 [Dokdonia pacifica]|uniref:Uncharacterized protein n=1 Tax=Dokdonia pacifica TaxID=1627892 RepID=A0A238ZNR4_9FLAO|nr:hypothetical protein [Dokdonia pacifica]GGG07674.1 hypothetical protein GCM10011344_05310 [Dokdonia pacifica]SNR85035.1 hypothetical protein SAMN06265376_103396 [Dokdonia pacifica]